MEPLAIEELFDNIRVLQLKKLRPEKNLIYYDTCYNHYMEKFIITTLPSNRDFGFLFAGVFALLSAYSAYRGTNVFIVYSLLIASAFVMLVSIFKPVFLLPLNKFWMKLGELMGKIVSPLVLGIIFFLLITPVALVTRLFGRDVLRLKYINTQSYWVDRDPHGPAGDTFKNQF